MPFPSDDGGSEPQSQSQPQEVNVQDEANDGVSSRFEMGTQEIIIMSVTLVAVLALVISLFACIGTTKMKRATEKLLRIGKKEEAKKTAEAGG